MRKQPLFLLAMTIFVLCDASFGATVKLGLIGDIHAANIRQPDNPQENNRYYSQAKAKTERVIDDFVTAPVDVIITLGDIIDLAPHDITNGTLARICTSLKRGSSDNEHGIPIHFVLGNHECGCSDKSNFLMYPSVHQSGFTLNYPPGRGEYGYFDIGNVRCFILDTNYGSRTEPYPYGYVQYGEAYLSDAELAWLNSTLTDTDAQGKFSVAFFHHAVEIVCVSPRIFLNWEDLINIIRQHRVILVAWGHDHKNSQSRSITNNSLGQPILFTGVEAVVDGNYVADPKNTAGAIATIDDQTGAVNIRGLYDQNDGKFVNRFVNANGDNSNGLSEATGWTTLDGALTNVKNDPCLYDSATKKIKTNLTLWVKRKQTLSSTANIRQISGDSSKGYKFIIRGYGNTIYDNTRADIDGNGMLYDIIQLKEVNDVELHSLELHNTTGNGNGISFSYTSTVDGRIAINDCNFYDVYHSIVAEKETSRLRSLLIDHCIFGKPRATDGSIRTAAVSTIFTNNILDGYSTGASVEKMGLYLRDYADGGRQFAIIAGNIFKDCYHGTVIGYSTFDGVAYVHHNTFYGITCSGVWISAPGVELVEHSNIYVVDDKVYDASIRRDSGNIFSTGYSVSNSWSSNDAMKDAGDNFLIFKDEQPIGFLDPNADDFRLNRSSIALNTGSPTVVNGKTNKGAWQGISQTVPLPNCTEWLEADLNDDCKVDFRDLDILSQSWLECHLEPPSECQK